MTGIKRLKPGERLIYEKVLIAKDGRRIPVEISTRSFEHQGRRMVISIVRDIAESKRAKEARKLFDSNPNAVMLASFEEGRHVEVNDAFCALIGYTREVRILSRMP